MEEQRFKFSEKYEYQVENNQVFTKAHKKKISPVIKTMLTTHRLQALYVIFK